MTWGHTHTQKHWSLPWRGDEAIQECGGNRAFHGRGGHMEGSVACAGEADLAGGSRSWCQWCCHECWCEPSSSRPWSEASPTCSCSEKGEYDPSLPILTCWRCQGLVHPRGHFLAWSRDTWVGRDCSFVVPCVVVINAVYQTFPSLHPKA